MQTHPNAVFLTKLYANFSDGNFEGMLAMLPENFTFQVAGKSAFAGKFTKANFVEGFAKKLAELSNHSYQFQAHDVLASDMHGTVLGTVKVSLQGKALELRMVHVWRFEKGTPIAGYEYTRDLYAFDLAFSP
jgi:ketosteroid isomerase-like protein